MNGARVGVGMGGVVLGARDGTEVAVGTIVGVDIIVLVAEKSVEEVSASVMWNQLMIENLNT